MLNYWFFNHCTYLLIPSLIDVEGFQPSSLSFLMSTEVKVTSPFHPLLPPVNE